MTFVKTVAIILMKGIAVSFMILILAGHYIELKFVVDSINFSVVLLRIAILTELNADSF